MSAHGRIFIRQCLLPLWSLAVFWSFSNHAILQYQYDEIKRALLALGFATAITIWGLRHHITFSSIRSRRILAILAIAFALWSLGLASFTTPRWESLFSASQTTLWIFGTIAMCHLSHASLQRVLTALTLSTAVMICGNLSGLIRYFPFPEFGLPPLGNTSFAAEACALSLLVAIDRGMRNPRYRLGWLVVAGILMAGLWYTGSRISMISTIVVLVVGGWYSYSRSLVSAKHIALFASYLACITIFSAHISSHGARVDAQGERYARLLSGDFESTENHRLHMWKSSFTMLMQKPITGTGPGTFRFEYPQASVALNPKGTHEENHALVLTVHPHNIFVMGMVETGFVGLLLLLGIGLGIAGYGVQRLRSAHSIRSQHTALLPTLMLFSMGAAWQINTAMTFPTSQLFAAFAVALLFSAETQEAPTQRTSGNISWRAAVIAIALLCTVIGMRYEWANASLSLRIHQLRAQQISPAQYEQTTHRAQQLAPDALVPMLHHTMITTRNAANTALADQTLERLIASYPRIPTTLQFGATYYAKQGDKTQATALITEAARLAPRDPGIQSLATHIHAMPHQ